MQASPQYPGGVALRFARVKRYRSDKTAAEADTIAAVRAFAPLGQRSDNALKRRLTPRETVSDRLTLTPDTMRAVSAKLTRTIGLTQATAMVVGTIVGSSIFVQPSEVSKAVPSFGGMLLVWIAAGALTWFGASICAELSSAYPKTGGVYVFLREMFSPAAGFLWGWAMFWSMHSGIIAAIAMVFGRYTATIVPLNDLGIRLVAVGAIAVLSAINYVGVRPGSSVQTALTIAKIAAIGVLLVLLFGMGTLQMPASLGAIAAARVPARAGRRAVRLRRLAHGDLRGRGDAQPRADHSARADARHRRRRRHLPGAEQRVSAACCRSTRC